MTVRRRILLAALAVGVVGTLVVFIWLTAPKEGTPKLEFTVGGYTNDWAKYAVLTITNSGPSSLTIVDLSVLLEAGQPQRFLAPGFPMTLGRRTSRTILIPLWMPPASSMTLSASGRTLPPPPWATVAFGSQTAKWRVKCFVKRETLSHRLRKKIEGWPLIGRPVAEPFGYEVESQTFTQ